MSLQTKVIGRTPTDHGPYNPNTSYGKKFCVTLFGCMWESLHDNNNTAPAVWDGGDTITPNLVDWKKVSGDYNAWLMNQNKPAQSVDYPFNGMGRVKLLKHVVDGHNLLYQDDFYKDGPNNTRVPNTNTVFEVPYEFELAENVTIPDGCVLKFVGGCMKNGTLNTNGCYIDAGLSQIFDNIKFNAINTYNEGLEVVDNIYVKAVNANAFVNKKLNTLVPANGIINRRYTYVVRGSSSSTTIDGSNVNVTIDGTTYIVATVTADSKYKLYYNFDSILGIVDGTGEMASGVVDSLSGITFYAITQISYSNISRISNNEIHPEWFGAKGDNSNDDSIAINTALDLAHRSAKTVILGSGTYKINDTLVVNSQVNFTGNIPVIENPINTRLSVNTDIGILIFDTKDNVGSYQIRNIGFVPFSNANEYNYIGIKIYHSQNYANISKVGIRDGKIGIDIDALYGVQMLRCEDISMLVHDESEHCIAINIKSTLQGWVNANYFRFACADHCAAIKAVGGGDNVLDGGAGYTESTQNFIMTLDHSVFIVRGGLYKETGLLFQLRNSSLLIIEGDSAMIGEIDCDPSSQVKYVSPNYQTRVEKLNNKVSENDVILSHYKMFSKKPFFWFETIGRTIKRPVESNASYTNTKYNGRLFTSGYCKVPMGNINIKNKTIAIRVISAVPQTSQTTYPFFYNFQESDQNAYYLNKRSSGINNCGIFSGPSGQEAVLEKGETIIFLKSKTDDYTLKHIYPTGDTFFKVSDIYVIDKPSSEITGTERLRLLDVINDLDSYVNEEGFLTGYNKGEFTSKPSDLTSDDAGFEYFDTTNGRIILWNGSSWVKTDGSAL